MRLSFAICVTLLSLSFSVTAAEYIESFHSEVDIRRNGDLYVTETIVVHAEGNSIKRGIYRDFPTRYKDDRGRNLVLDFDVLSVQRDGATEPYFIKDRSNGKRVYIGDANVFLAPGFYEYRLQYRTSRQLGFFDDFDELYWNVTGNGWSFEIGKASALIKLPDRVSDFQLNGYTGRQGSVEQNLIYRRVGNNQAYFETSKSLGKYEGLTIVAGWPKGLIDEPSAAQQRAWFVEDNKSILIVFIGAGLLLIYYLLIWLRVGRDPAAGVIVPHYQAPRGYSPASIRFVQNMGYDKTCFTTAIINLAVKGAVDINEDDGDFKLVKSGAATATLAAGESQVISGLFGDGRDNISITQSNHSILSKAIGKHRKSLKRDYAKKYFSTNSWFLVPAVLFSLGCIFFAIKNLGSEELIFKTAFGTMFSVIPLIMFIAAIRGLRRGGLAGFIRMGINFVMLAIFAGFFFSSNFKFDRISEGISWWLVGGIISIPLISMLFYHLLKAPTLAGRKLLDQIEGFKHYLEVAEDDEIALRNAPKFTTDIYESYLPYAIALDLENEWTAKLDRAVEGGTIERGYTHPRWYHSRHYHGSSFSRALSGSFNSAIASSSVAPGSSSGSGGSSGGGGGGGGGGGW